MGSHLVASLLTFFATLATPPTQAELSDRGAEAALPPAPSLAGGEEGASAGVARPGRATGAPPSRASVPEGSPWQRRLTAPGRPELRAVGGEVALLCAPGTSGELNLDDVRWAAAELGLTRGTPCLPASMAAEDGGVEDEPGADEEPGGPDHGDGPPEGEPDEPPPDEGPDEDDPGC